MSRLAVHAAIAGVTALLSLAPAHAVVRTEHHPGAGACDAATSADAANLRERNYALVNVGANTAYVTCSLNGHGLGAGSISGYGAQSISVYFHSLAGQVRTASCTASEALMPTGGSATRSTNVTAFGTQDSVRFTATDVNAAGNWRTPVFTCALPNGVGISGVWYVFNDG